VTTLAGSLRTRTAQRGALAALALALVALALPAGAGAETQVGVERAQAEVDRALALVDESVDAAAAGERERGYELARSAYLDHFELVEIPLRLRNPNLVLDLEFVFADLRDGIRDGAPLGEVRESARETRAGLRDVKRELEAKGFAAPALAFGFSFTILFREGLEAVLLIAVLLAIAGPVTNYVGRPERNVVVLIDQSASMKSIESDGRPRIEHARQAATDFIQNLAPGSKAMIIAFSNRAEVVCTFTNDKRRLKERIESIEANDGHSQIGEALQLAVAYSSSFVENPSDPGFVPDTVQVADIELFSDGRLTDANEEFVTRAKMMHHRVGEASDNVGITAFDVRREIDQPGKVSVFAQVQNFGAAPVRLDASLYLDDKLLSVEPVSLGPSREATTVEPESLATWDSMPVPTSGASERMQGTACRCMLDPISARFASSCSRNGINAAATDTSCFGDTSM